LALALAVVVGFQEPDLGRRAGDIMQYLLGAGILFVVGLELRNTRVLAAVETLLSNPDSGLSPVLAMQRQRLVDLAGDMQNLMGRVHGQEDEMGRLRSLGTEI